MVAVGTPDQLKATSGGKTLTIWLAAGTDPSEVCRLLAREHGLEGQADADGRVVKAAVREAAQAHAAVGTLLDSGASIEDFALSEPSLEDVFFALTSASGKEAAI
ncbi:DUF4162 domain-containing protein [Cohnella thailandensis]|uniref:ATP-binding protein DrrA1-3 family domain-containing protein n=1 Tax=Cohnella thailandensis TaxID=557557 RepID=UPI001D7051FB|nr:ABC-type uncharacterized transport system ATPase subunit [Cohnella thailandensis]